MKIKKVRRFAWKFALLLLIVLPTLVFAQSSREKRAVRQLVDSLENQFSARTLGSLDRRRVLSGKVNVVIEHSLMDGKDQFEVRNFKTMAGVERWLRSREMPGAGDFMVPLRVVTPQSVCRKGRCTYDLNGYVLHNHIYLKHVHYVYRGGRAYLKKIYIYCGD